MTLLAIANGVVALGLCGQPPRTDAAFWSFLPKRGVVGRCADGSAEQIAARQAWEALRDQVAALTEASDPGPAVAALRGLLRMPCLHLAAEHGPPPLPDHALALKRWWEDGGYSWLWNFIEPMELGRQGDLRHVTVLPPDARRVLFNETNHDPGLTPLLCSQSEPACGAETLGWITRTEAAFKPLATERNWWGAEPPDPPLWDACEAKARGAAAIEVYTTWRTCLGARQAAERALPLGRTRSPAHGWVFVSGRRGHYQFCDTLHAFDLATGSAYLADSCSALVLNAGGGVDFRQTDEHREWAVRGGRISIDNLREAAWVLFLKDQAERVRTRSETYPIPRGVKVQFRLGANDEIDVVGGRTSWSTAWTRLDWLWFRDGGRLRGELTWPQGSDPVESHAASLLAIAERSFVEGCPSVDPPSPSPMPDPRVSSRDADPSTLSRTQRELWTRLVAFRRSVACEQEAKR